KFPLPGTHPLVREEERSLVQQRVPLRGRECRQQLQAGVPLRVRETVQVAVPEQRISGLRPAAIRIGFPERLPHPCPLLRGPPRGESSRRTSSRYRSRSVRLTAASRRGSPAHAPGGGSTGAAAPNHGSVRRSRLAQASEIGLRRTDAALTRESSGVV